jgi:hypothetical protein
MRNTPIRIVESKPRPKASILKPAMCCAIGWSAFAGAASAAGEPCDPRFETCFQGITDLPGGNIFSEALGVAHVNGVVVVVGESSSTVSSVTFSHCNEAVRFSGGQLRAVLNPAAAPCSSATDVAIVGTKTIVTGKVVGGGMSAEQETDAPVNPMMHLNSTAVCGTPLIGRSISDNGVRVVGDALSPQNGNCAYTWTQAGGSATVPRMSVPSSGFGISPNANFFVGDAGLQAWVYPTPNVLCFPGECVADFIGSDRPGGTLFSTAYGVSNGGVVVGLAGISGGGIQAFRWTPSSFVGQPSVMTLLGDLPGGSTNSDAKSITGDGQTVVGGGTSALGQEAIFWHPSFGLRNLRDFAIEELGSSGLTGWTLSRANAISTNGLAIAGTGRNPAGNTEGWFLTLPDCDGNNRWDRMDAPLPTARAARTVFDFNGVNSFVEVTAPTSELRITGPLTIEGWIYLHGLSASQAIIALGDVGEDPSTNLLYAIEINTGGDFVITHERADASDAVVVADTNLVVRRWYHFAVTRTIFSASTLEYAVQIDDLKPIGLAVGGRPAGGTVGTLRIGRGHGTTLDRPLDGYLSDIRIWNLVRSPEQIIGDMFVPAPSDTTGLVASWAMDEPTGTVLADAVGSNDLFVAVGGTRFTVGADCNLNRIPDSCEEECNGNGIPDLCEIRDGTREDCNLNGIPDDCEADCNGNSVPDDCDIRDATSCDNNLNDRPDECDVAEVLAELISQDRAATEVFRNERDDPDEPTTFGDMIQNYGRPWKPETGQTPGGGVCVGGSRDGLACAGGDPCPEGSCIPPAETGTTRDPAERLRILTLYPSCLSTDLAQKVFNEIFAFEMLLGNEAFADAMDPTVGEGIPPDSISLEQVPGVFAFAGVPGINSLMDEELALLRGREIALPASPDEPLNDAPATNLNGMYPQFGTAERAAIYNRLRPNAFDTLGSVGYRSNYGFSNTPSNATASEKFPQGHGDAFGYYLTATTIYLDAFGAARDDPVPASFSQNMVESLNAPEIGADCGEFDCESIVDDDGITHHVGFHSVRNMAAAMAARARAANRIVDLTFRRDYREDADTPLTDTDAARAWATADWARRGGVGAYLDWAVLNHHLPLPQEETADAVTEVHRRRMEEVRILASAVDEMQDRVDAAGAGLNPLGLVSNVVPFRIIQPGQLLNFLEGGASSGQSHYGIVRSAALEAIKNARGILKRANQASNRLRGNEEVFADFENQVRATDVGFNDRLIEIFGLPSPSDRADNDGEDNDGDGVQLTDGVNDPHDDFIEAGCDGQCAGSPDLVNFLVDSQALEDLGQQPRSAVGQVQLAMFELRTAALRVQVAALSVANLEALIEDKAENVALVRVEAVQALEIRATACDDQFTVIDRKKELTKAREERGLIGRVGGLIGAGAACYFGSSGGCEQAASSAGSFFGQILGETASDHFSGSPIDEQFSIEREELRINCWQTAQLTKISNNQTIRALEIELEDLIRRTPQAILELAVAETQAQQALAVVQKSFLEGRRLVDERDRNRRVQSDKLQQFRFRDLAFRTFRNQALEQYGAFFDLAGRYVMLAARAFAYEYNERDEVSEQMQRLYRERLLGTESAAGQGLESVIARLDQKRQESDFVARLQKLSLFDHGGDEFSLRKNLLGLAINPSVDTNQQQLEKNKAFRAFLESNIVQDLLDVPAFRQFASFDGDRDSGPALVLSIPTEVAGRTFFGQRRGTTFGAPANFDTCSNPKVFEFAILLEGVDNPGAIGVDSQLIFAHFLPVGSSMLRTPAGGNCSLRAVRTWAVVDQRIPGVSAVYRDTGGAILDSFDLPRLATSPELDVINPFPVTHAQIRNTQSPVFQDDLAGWSAWNTQWLLAIPGRQFADPNDDAAVVRRKLLILIFDADANGNPRSPDANLGIDDIKLRIKAYGKPS